MWNIVTVRIRKQYFNLWLFEKKSFANKEYKAYSKQLHILKNEEVYW